MIVDDVVRLAAQALLDAEPPDSRACVLTDAEDHDWCWVVKWTTQRWLQTRQPEDSPQPGYGPIAVDKAAHRASYLSSVYLPIALDVERVARRNRGEAV